MAVESATYIGQLNTAYPAGGEPIAQGDDHLRLIKTTLKNSFPNLNAAMTAVWLPFTPAGALAATNVQAALVELDTEKAALAGATFTGNISAKGVGIQGSGTGYNALFMTNRQFRVGTAGTDIEVVNAGNNAVNQILYDNGSMWSRGSIAVGTAVTAGGTSDGGLYGQGAIELFSTQPFIDFKTTSVDYRYRLTLSGDNLQIQGPSGAFRVGASGEAYAPLTANAADALTRKDYVDSGLSSKPYGDTCTGVGFNGGNVNDPYMRHAGAGQVVPLVKSCNNAGYLGMSTGNRCEFHWNSGLYAQVDSATGWFAIQNSLGSDKRLKEQDLAEPKTTGLATIMALKPVRFSYKENSLSPKVGVRWGFFAQDLQAVDPVLVVEGRIPEDETDYLFYAEDGLAQLIAIQTRAIQELSAKVTALEAQLAAQ